MRKNREQARNLTSTVALFDSLGCLILFAAGVWQIIDERWEYGAVLVLLSLLNFLMLQWAISVVKLVADLHAVAFPDEPHQRPAAASSRPARTLGKPIYDE